MAIVTTYVCDVTGQSGMNKEDFVLVSIVGNGFEAVKYSNAVYKDNRKKQINRLVHITVAERLGLIEPKSPEQPQPEVTFESKLRVLLEDFVQMVVEENLLNQ